MNSLEQTLVNHLKSTRCSFATVESCTGGLIAHRVTNVAGSSEVFWGSIIAYDNSAKERLAGVSTEILIRHGAVSREVAQAMAEGGLRAMDEALNAKAAMSANAPGLAASHAQARICVATTGIAGPGGGSSEKPVGLCFIAVAAKGKPSFANEFRATRGITREQCKMEFADMALSIVLKQLAGEYP